MYFLVYKKKFLGGSSDDFVETNIRSKYDKDSYFFFISYFHIFQLPWVFKSECTCSKMAFTQAQFRSIFQVVIGSDNSLKLIKDQIKHLQ